MRATALPLVIIFCLLSISSAAQFGPPQLLIELSLSGPEEVWAADIDLDGDMDVLGCSDRELKLFRGNGDGTFLSGELLYTTTQLLRSPRVADLDEDGDPDIVLCIRGANAIAWLSGNGDGTFGALEELVDLQGASDLELEDMDGDGDLDMVATDEFETRVLWFKNDGNAEFPEWEIICSNNLGDRVVLGDMDGDGDQDPVFSSGTFDKLAWARNLGGDFNDLEIVLSNILGGGMAVGDLNNDGLLDIVGTANSPTQVGFFFNTGNGSFDPVELLDNPPSRAGQVRLADTDQDGDLDLIITTNPDTAYCYPNDGAGIFTTPFALHEHLGIIDDIHVTDLDGDTDLDLLIAAGTRPRLEWLENADGTWILRSIFPGVGRAKDLEVFDLDADGYADILSADGLAGDFFVMHGTLDQQFLDPEVVAWSGPAGSSHEIRESDLDLDGDLDLILGSSGSIGVVRTLLNDGNGSWATAMVLDGQVDTYECPFATDINDDVIPDLVSLNYQGPLVWRAGQGDGTFSEPVVISTLVEFYVVATDADGDGDKDIAFNSPSGLFITLNDGLGNFGTADSIGELNSAQPLLAIDIDEDGDEDLVTSGYDSDLVLFRCDGSGSYSPAVSLGAACPYTARMQLADMNEDGLDDLVILCTAVGLFYFPNLPFGDAGPPITLSTESLSSLGAFDMGDLDGDGDLDVVCTTSLNIVWLENLMDEITTAVDPATEDEPCIVIPNPVSGMASLQFPKPLPADATLSLIDMHGKILEQMSCAQVSRIPLDLTHRAPGMYVLRIAAGNDIRTVNCAVSR